MSLYQGAVVAPTALPDGSIPAGMAGRTGELITADLHGKFYTGAYRGKSFTGSTAAAGTTIPISSTVSPTFTLYNPIGSGVNVELISYSSSVQNATLVVSSVLLGLVTGLVVAPTSTTGLTANPAAFGGSGTAKAQLFSAATLATAATLFFEVGGYSATSGSFSEIHYEFDGRLNLSPGCLVHVCGTAAQTSASTQTFVWAEWLQ